MKGVHHYLYTYICREFKIEHSLKISQSFIFNKYLSLGRTALYCAAEEGWDNLIPYLIDHNGAIESPSNSGETPLIIATKSGFSQTINVLIENGAIITTRDKSGHIALDYAISINEKTIQDEQIFDQILTRMLKLKSNEEALRYLHTLLEKYYKLRLTGSITSLLDRVSELRARKGQ